MAYQIAALALALVSLSALAYAARLALRMAAERRAMRERIARAVRPVHGRTIMREAPARAVNRPGEN